MKTFSDLKFKKHGAPGAKGKHALMFFDNGRGVSVVRFKFGHTGRFKRFMFWKYVYGSYTSNEREWELAVLKGNKERWDLDYTTPITKDVIGHLSESLVTETMIKVQSLPTVT